jgi:hypothetical protein
LIFFEIVRLFQRVFVQLGTDVVFHLERNTAYFLLQTDGFHVRSYEPEELVEQSEHADVVVLRRQTEIGDLIIKDGNNVVQFIEMLFTLEFLLEGKHGHSVDQVGQEILDEIDFENYFYEQLLRRQLEELETEQQEILLAGLIVGSG